MGRMRNAYKILIGKDEGKIPLEKTESRWEVILKWMFKKQIV
jgi:hypothetical protein